jgi:hypothetical protein
MTNNTVLGRSAVAIVLCGLGAGCGIPADPSLPIYRIEQTDSTHPGYRRTTVSTGTASYVNDFEERSLQLRSSNPQHAVGRSPIGTASVFAISGQDPSAYLAVDVGSEMPAYEVFRNASHPPFDWRHATFQSMRSAAPVGPAANKETADPAVIEDLVRALRDGTPASPPVTAPPMPHTPPIMPATAPPGVYGILLFSDQLPGLVFRPSFYLDASGQVYLTDGLRVTMTSTEQSFQATWIPAGPLFTRWVQTP